MPPYLGRTFKIPMNEKFRVKRIPHFGEVVAFTYEMQHALPFELSSIKIPRWGKAKIQKGGCVVRITVIKLNARFYVHYEYIAKAFSLFGWI